MLAACRGAEVEDGGLGLQGAVRMPVMRPHIFPPLDAYRCRPGMELGLQKALSISGGVTPHIGTATLRLIVAARMRLGLQEALRIGGV